MPAPKPQQLGRKLSAHGFEAEEIRDALHWLDGLSLATQGMQIERSADDEAVPRHPARRARAGVSSSDNACASTPGRAGHLGAECLGFIRFLESSNVLSCGLREIVVERAMAAPGDPVALDELKIIVLMVHWSTGIEPDALVLDELCEPRGREGCGFVSSPPHGDNT
jgi:Smg protein